MLRIRAMQNNPLNPDLLLASYDYDLPEASIADRPVAGRQNSKLLVYRVKTDSVEHRHYFDLPDILDPKDHLVLNESKVFPCRLIGVKPTGGRCEVFILSLIKTKNSYPALIKTSGKKHIGDRFIFGGLIATLSNISDDGSFYVEFNMSDEKLLETLEKIGKIPIPPYIRGGVADEKDLEDYQTVYAGTMGSVAAPTAGLHFTPELFEGLKVKGIDKSFVTLHVGAGTFKPVSTQNILEHSMHEEFYSIDEEALKSIRAHQGNIIAVGTTSLRVLESQSDDRGFIKETDGFQATDIFLYPGKKVHSIKGLITNFHLPKSTLLMLVSSLIGREKALELYKIAIENDYRFFSYGDGMIIIRD